MTVGWSIYVDVLVFACLVGCGWLLWINRTATVDKAAKGQPLDSEHDGIQELNNPLPAWWTWLFVASIVYAIGYLALYPGLGSYPGILDWTSAGQHEAEVQVAEARYGPIFARYAAQEITTLQSEPHAIEMGGRLFRNHCSTCHGSDARGGIGYPNLTDNDWLYGGTPEAIVSTITNGRIGNMPALGAVVGGDPGVKAVAQYVLSLSGRDHDKAKAKQGAATYASLCAVCHGVDGRGNQAVGAPNLTDNVWLHGGKLADIEGQIHDGRINQMPAHRDLISKEKIHLLATYVYSLSHEPGSGAVGL